MWGIWIATIHSREKEARPECRGICSVMVNSMWHTPCPNLPASTFHAPRYLNLLPDGGIIPVNHSKRKSYEYIQREIHVELNKGSNYE